MYHHPGIMFAVPRGAYFDIKITKGKETTTIY